MIILWLNWSFMDCKYFISLIKYATRIQCTKMFLSSFVCPIKKWIKWCNISFNKFSRRCRRKEYEPCIIAIDILHAISLNCKQTIGMVHLNLEHLNSYQTWMFLLNNFKWNLRDRIIRKIDFWWNHNEIIRLI